MTTNIDVIKPGTHPQPAEGRLWARAWFTELVSRKTCVCLCMFVCTHPREQTISSVVKTAYPQQVKAKQSL